MHKVLLVTLITVFGLAFAQKPNVQLILDVSGSMWLNLESGETKIDAAKTVLIDFIGGLPSESLNMGLRLYGATVSGIDPQACTDSQLIIPIDGLNKGGLINTVQSTDPKGGTPIVYALGEAIKDFESVPDNSQKLIILVTDGAESCGEDLDVAAKKVQESGIDLQVIGFGLSEKAATTFESVGAFANAMSALELATVLKETTQQITVVPEVKPTISTPRIEIVDIPINPIFFVSERQGISGIYTMDTNGGNQKLVIESENEDIKYFSVDVSPNGNQIVFHGLDNLAKTAFISTANNDGSNLKNIDFEIDMVFVGHPNWSPDGENIAFTCSFEGDRTNPRYYEVCKSNIDGTQVVPLTNNSFQDDTPIWSPDGTKIAFYGVRKISGRPFQHIFIMDSNGLNQEQISNSDSIYGKPWSWSPDGKRLAITSNIGGSTEIFIIDSNGENIEQITFNDVDEYGARWSTYDNSIVFESELFGTSEILRMDLKGENLIRLTENGFEDTAPNW